MELKSLKIVYLLSAVCFSCIQCTVKGNVAYGSADTTDPLTKIPEKVEPTLDYWMRDTWVTFGQDGYY